MTNYIIPELQAHYQGIAKFYNSKILILINFIRSLGYSDNFIAKLLGVNRSILSRDFKREDK